MEFGDSYPFAKTSFLQLVVGHGMIYFRPNDLSRVVNNTIQLEELLACRSYTT